VRSLLIIALGCCAIVALPLIAVATSVFQDGGDVWLRLFQTVLPACLLNTAILAVGVGACTLVVGAGTAWLVTACRFPGSGLFAWGLLLPLAVPTYLIAYVYSELLTYAGPVQGRLRGWFGWETKSDYWFPDVHTVGGAVALMSAVLYPYVYLLARNAFLEQSAAQLEAARTLGRGPWRIFLGVALPLARPALAGGAALAVMEALADFGAVQHLAVDTFTTQIYRTFFNRHAPVAATQLAVLLVACVAAVLFVERRLRGRARFHHDRATTRQLAPIRLRTWKAALAFCACAAPIAIGFAVPVARIAWLAWGAEHRRTSKDFWELSANSFGLAVVAALLLAVAALLMIAGRRFARGRTAGAAVRFASLGYAVPGTVIAVGILGPLGWIDNHLWEPFRSRVWPGGPGLVLSGTVVALLYAYLVRFLAVSVHAVDAGYARLHPHLDQAGRSLGAGPWGVLGRVHLPLLKGPLLAACLLGFVDVMKELPATVIVRPADFETLAVRVFTYASDERLAQAALPALAIVAVGIVPVILLSWAIARARPGTGSCPGEGA